MLPHLLTIFEIQKCYQNDHKFNGVYSINDLPKTKDWTYVINLDEYKSIETHWIAWYVNVDNERYFDSFGIEHISKKKSYATKISNEIFIEFKQIIQKCVNTFALTLLILCLKIYQFIFS